MCSLINVSSLNFFTTMSKRSLFWGQASGKLGEAVFYRAGGEQRTRAYVKAVKNPKTLAQMMQRITMGNLVSMYSALKPILSQSFPLRAVNRSAFNEFVSANKNARSYAIFKDDIANRFFWPVDITIARGDVSLPTRLEFVPSEEDEAMGLTYPYCNWPVLTTAVSAKALGIDVTGYIGEGAESMKFKKLTPYQVYQALTANGNPYGLPSKFVITIYTGSLDAGWVAFEGANGLMAGGYSQYVCSAVESECSYKFVGNELTAGEGVIAVADCEESNDGNDVNIYSLMVGYGLKYKNMAAGVIVSFKEEGKLRVTTSKVYGDADLLDATQSLLPGGDNYDLVLKNYGYNPDSILV